MAKPSTRPLTSVSRVPPLLDQGEADIRGRLGHWQLWRQSRLLGLMGGPGACDTLPFTERGDAIRLQQPHVSNLGQMGIVYLKFPVYQEINTLLLRSISFCQVIDSYTTFSLS